MWSLCKVLPSCTIALAWQLHNHVQNNGRCSNTRTFVAILSYENFLTQEFNAKLSTVLQLLQYCSKFWIMLDTKLPFTGYNFAHTYFLHLKFVTCCFKAKSEYEILDIQHGVNIFRGGGQCLSAPVRRNPDIDHLSMMSHLGVSPSSDYMYLHLSLL